MSSTESSLMCVYCGSTEWRLMRAADFGWLHVNCARCEAWAGRCPLDQFGQGPALTGITDARA